MKAFPLAIALLLSISNAGPVMAAPWHLGDWWRELPNCVGALACVSFQRKPLPCVEQSECFECAPYCRPPLPCARPVRAAACDVYCRKPLPNLNCSDPGCRSLGCKGLTGSGAVGW